MTNIKRTKGETTIYKTLSRKQNIEHHVLFQKRVVRIKFITFLLFTDVTLEGLDFPDCKFAWGAVQAFETFGLVSLVCSFIFGILKLCLWRDKSILIMICINGCFLASTYYSN